MWRSNGETAFFLPGLFYLRLAVRIKGRHVHTLNLEHLGREFLRGFHLTYVLTAVSSFPPTMHHFHVLCHFQHLHVFLGFLNVFPTSTSPYNIKLTIRTHSLLLNSRLIPFFSQNFPTVSPSGALKQQTFVGWRSMHPQKNKAELPTIFPGVPFGGFQVYGIYFFFGADTFCSNQAFKGTLRHIALLAAAFGSVHGLVVPWRMNSWHSDQPAEVVPNGEKVRDSLSIAYFLISAPKFDEHVFFNWVGTTK